METQEFFKKWKKDSPKSFEEFKIFLEKQWYPFDDTYIDNYGNFWIEMGDDRKSELPFEMLTGIIHKFFFDNNINSQQIYYNYAITNNYILNQEIEKKGFLKAAEILEKEIK